MYFPGGGRRTKGLRRHERAIVNGKGIKGGWDWAEGRLHLPLIPRDIPAATMSGQSHRTGRATRRQRSSHTPCRRIPFLSDELREFVPQRSEERRVGKVCSS